MKTLQVILSILFVSSVQYRVDAGILDVLGLTEFGKSLTPLLNKIKITPVESKQRDREILKVIQNKVAELKNANHLQDNVKTNNDYETTILEFVPKKNESIISHKVLRHLNNTAKENIDVNKYKKMREKINKALNKDSVTEKTKKYILKKFDYLINILLRSQCHWKSGMKQRSHQINNTYETLMNNVSNFKRAFIKPYVSMTEVNTFQVDLKEAFTKFDVFFENLMVDLNSLQGLYNIRCQVEESPQPDPKFRSDKGNEEDCRNIQICSKELTEYMYSFYEALNDTTVNALKNYAAMYARDVNTDGSNERAKVEQSILTSINALAATVKTAFIKQTKRFELDKDNSQINNRKKIHRYIDKTVLNVERKVKALLSKVLASFESNLRISLKKDVKFTLAGELKNLINKQKSSLCQSFKKCNDISLRRASIVENKNDIYVDVQVNFDNNLKGIIMPAANDKRRKANYPFDATAKNKRYVKDSSNANNREVTYNVTRTTKGSDVFNLTIVTVNN